MTQCTVPISAHFTVSGGRVTAEEYITAAVEASCLADLIVDEFGLDFDQPQAKSFGGDYYAAA